MALPDAPLLPPSVNGSTLSTSMPNESPELLMYAAADVARVAGDVALRHFRSVLHVETKGDGSPVTIADREAERAARAWIEARFPHDGILGEEQGVARP